ncbi:MAG: bactofilin family protein [Chlamydiota bacterium]
MFKKYPKNPFDQETVMQGNDSDNGSMPQSVKAGNYSNGDRHHSTPYSPINLQEEYSSNVPPRIFDNNRPMKQTKLQEYSSYPEADNDDYSQDNSLWDDKIAPITSSSYPGDEFEGEGPETVLGESVSFKGSLKFERFLRVEGNFEGELISEGKLVVGPKGVVKSNINMREVIVEGFIDGDIVVKDRMELRGDAQVRGNITTKSLIVDEGATIIGNVKVVPSGEPLQDNESTSHGD